MTQRSLCEIYEVPLPATAHPQFDCTAQYITAYWHSEAYRQTLLAAFAMRISVATLLLFFVLLVGYLIWRKQP